VKDDENLFRSRDDRSAGTIGLCAEPNAHAGAANKNSSIANPNDGSPYADPAIANLTPIVPGQDFAGHKRGR